MKETKEQRRAQQAAKLDIAIKPFFDRWLDDLRETGITVTYPMPAVNEPLRVTSAFGNRKISKAKGGTASPNHRAIDVVPVRDPVGRDVMINSPIEGRVLFAGTPDDDSGVSVIIGGFDGVIYSVAHGEAGSLKVEAGDRVGRNQPLMLMGDTGVTTRKCLHVVERALPLKADGLPKSQFKDWRWQKSNSTGNLHVPQHEVQKAFDAWEKKLGHSITFRDMDRDKPSLRWLKDPDVGDRVPGATVADLTPQYFATVKQHRDAFPKDSPMALALNSILLAGGRPLSDNDEPRALAKKPVSKPLPKKQQDDEGILAGMTSLAMSACEIVGFCSPNAKATPSKPSGKHR